MLKGERFGGSFQKTGGSRKVARVIKKRKIDKVENDSKADVRRRDRFCRFPRCGCKSFNLARHVAHLDHKGMGGDPSGERSKPERMIVLCSARHKENKYALDRGTIRIRPRTRKGTAGPCAFDVALEGLWTEVGRETRLHVFEPFTPAQATVLDVLAQMLS